MSTLGAITEFDCAGVLTIGTTVMNCPAWTVGDLWQLWGATQDYRIAERVVPFQDRGVIFPAWGNGLRVSLPVIITGHVTSAGVRNADPMAGLATNVRALRAAVLPRDPTTPDGTEGIYRSATLVLPNGTELTGSVMPLGLRIGSVTLSVARATLELRLVEMLEE